MKFKEIKKEADRQMKARRYQRDGDGRIIIHMNVKKDDSFLSEFSENDTPVISSEVAEHIESCTHALLPKEELTLRIHSDCIDEHEKQLYDSAIREYYMQQYIANERELRRDRFIVAILGILGVLVLGAEVAFDLLFQMPVWTEVIDIIAWVLLWEAVDIGILESRSLKVKRKRSLACLSMKIEYISSDKG